MHRIGKYKASDSMSELICQHYPVLLVISRFGISTGFGDKSIGEVCTENMVDTNTFLAIVNMFMDSDNGPGSDHDKVSAVSLLDYLHKSHDYFLEFRLPGIRENLLKVTGNDNELTKAIINYFDEYISEVRKHMMYEENNVFPYVKSLIEGKDSADYRIDIFSKQHDRVESRLTEFKHIIIKYYPARSTNELNSVLFDIFSCEKDLASHNAIEDRILVPMIVELEKNKNKSR